MPSWSHRPKESSGVAPVYTTQLSMAYLHYEFHIFGSNRIRNAYWVLSTIRGAALTEKAYNPISFAGFTSASQALLCVVLSELSARIQVQPKLWHYVFRFIIFFSVPGTHGTYRPQPLGMLPKISSFSLCPFFFNNLDNGDQVALMETVQSLCVSHRLSSWGHKDPFLSSWGMHWVWFAEGLPGTSSWNERDHPGPHD